MIPVGRRPEENARSGPTGLPLHIKKARSSWSGSGNAEPAAQGRSSHLAVATACGLPVAPQAEVLKADIRVQRRVVPLELFGSPSWHRLGPSGNGGGGSRRGRVRGRKLRHQQLFRPRGGGRGRPSLLPRHLPGGEPTAETRHVRDSHEHSSSRHENCGGEEQGRQGWGGEDGREV